MPAPAGDSAWPSWMPGAVCGLIVTWVVPGKPITGEEVIVGLVDVRDGEFCVEIPRAAALGRRQRVTGLLSGRALGRFRGYAEAGTSAGGQRRQRPKTRDSGGGVPVLGAVAPDVVSSRRAVGWDQREDHAQDHRWYHYLG